MKYYSILSDIFADTGIIKDPELKHGARLTAGSWIDVDEQALPLVFATNCDADEPPRHYMGRGIPVWSEAMCDAFRSAGVGNFQSIPAILTGIEDTDRWTSFFAINVLGKIPAADMAQSTYVNIGTHPNGTPLANFQSLVIDEDKALSFFRLAENPMKIIIDASIVEHLQTTAPVGGWGMTVRELNGNDESRFIGI